jgi:uncharacterized protein YggL (DUF469 family)
MIIKEIHLEKSKTIEVAGILGKDAYRKIVFGSNCEVEEGEDAIDAKNKLKKFINDAIAEEVLEMNEEVAAKKKSLGLS